MSKGISARAIDGPIVMSDQEVWCYWRLGTASTRWMTNDDLRSHVERLAASLGEWAGDDFHMVVARRRLDPRLWAAQIDEATGGAQEGWHDHLRQQVHQLADFEGKEIYLGIKLGDRADGISAVRDVLRGALARVGMSDPAPAGVERVRWRTEATRRDRGLSASAWHPRLATAAEVAWLIQRTVWRGLGEPPAPAGDLQRWGPGDLTYLTESIIDNSHLRRLQVDQPAGQTHVAFICLSSFPQTVGHLGWLGMLDSMRIATDVSIRGTVVGPGDALNHLRKRLLDVSDQQKHLAGAHRRDSALEMQRGMAEDLKLRIEADSTPLVEYQVAVAVSGATTGDLEGNVAELIAQFRQVGITAVCPAGDQLSLMLEGMPGDRSRTSTYTQVHDPDVVAGSLLTSTTELGDVDGDTTSSGETLTRGLVVGHVIEEHRAPVHLSLPGLIRRDGTGVVLTTGQPGGGKSSTMGLLAYQQALQGGLVMVVDPKGDFQRLHRLAELGVPVTELVVTGSTSAGLLDPFAVVKEPSEAAGIANSVLTLCLPPEQASQAGSVLLAACDQVSRALDPSMPALEALLADWGTPVAAEVAASMRALANMEFGRLIFAAPPSKGASLTVERLQRLTKPGIQLFNVSWITPSLQSAAATVAESPISARLASTSLYLMTLLVEQLVSRADKRQSATVVIDEAHALSNIPLGRMLMERLSLMGRSRNTNLVLGTQNIGHIPESVLANVAVHIAHHAGRGAECGLVLEALGAGDSETGRLVLDKLQPGQAVMRDQFGRVGRIKVDLPPAFADIMRTTPLAAVTKTEVRAAKADPAPAPSSNGHNKQAKASNIVDVGA